MVRHLKIMEGRILFQFPLRYRMHILRQTLGTQVRCFSRNLLGAVSVFSLAPNAAQFKG